MSTYTGTSVGGDSRMSAYERRMWEALNDHWQRRDNRRGLPNWAGITLERTGEATRSAVGRAVNAVPEAVKQPIRLAGDAVASAAVRPVVEAAIGILELVNAWVVELNDPKNVEKLARKRGLDIDSFTQLRQQELEVCDRLLTRNSLKWRTFGALEGGAMGLLATIPVAGTLGAIGLDVIIVQALSLSIASRIAYSYGYDARDPAEQEFVERLVRRSFMAQAAKVKPLHQTARAASAVKDRVNWSAKLRTDHRLLEALEKLMRQASTTGTKVAVKDVAKALPYVGIVVGAGTNAVILGNLAADAQRYCQTRFLCDKYGLPLPAALATYQDGDVDSETEAT